MLECCHCGLPQSFIQKSAWERFKNLESNELNDDIQKTHKTKKNQWKQKR